MNQGGNTETVAPVLPSSLEVIYQYHYVVYKFIPRVSCVELVAYFEVKPDVKLEAICVWFIH